MAPTRSRLKASAMQSSTQLAIHILYRSNRRPRLQENMYCTLQRTQSSTLTLRQLTQHRQLPYLKIGSCTTKRMQETPLQLSSLMLVRAFALMHRHYIQVRTSLIPWNTHGELPQPRPLRSNRMINQRARTQRHTHLIHLWPTTSSFRFPTGTDSFQCARPVGWSSTAT